MNIPFIMITWIEACISSPKFSININGELNGYFAGGRGLRQGDPISPYLFVLCMEIFHGIMAEFTKDNSFDYHWRCKQDKITHLCFADDLILFSKGNCSSVNVIKKVLDMFQRISGLTPNKTTMLRCLGFEEGKLHVRYFGTSLITSKLKATDCKALVDKITARIKSWTNKSLSYAGRLQLIQYVLFRIQVYWSGFFILPKKGKCRD